MSLVNNIKFGRLSNLAASSLITRISFLLIAVLFSPTATAHEYAASSFEARTDGKDITFSFRASAESILELVQRKNPTLENLEKSTLARYRDLSAEYFNDHFLVTNNNKHCLMGAFTRFQYAKAIDKMLVDFRVTCKDDLDALEIFSKLFIEEETTHSVISTFFHKRSKQQYFFAKESSALINVKKLRQASKRLPTEFQVVPPPPGTVFKKSNNNKAPKAELPKVEAPKVEAPKAETQYKIDDSSRQRATEMGTGFVTFLEQGVIHILIGLDHVLFVISLILAVWTWRQLAIVITSFTIAHSITLVLGSLDLVRASPYIVEPLIAASIVYVAMENVLRKKPKARTGITFGFGLIHGLGFSSVLHDIGLPPSILATSLLGFNLGVEIGQLIIVAPLFPLLIWLRKKKDIYKKAHRVACIAVATMAAYWFFERILAFIP